MYSRDLFLELLRTREIQLKATKLTSLFGEIEAKYLKVFKELTQETVVHMQKIEVLVNMQINESGYIAKNTINIYSDIEKGLALGRLADNKAAFVYFKAVKPKLCLIF